jgi:hypothetical protein
MRRRAKPNQTWRSQGPFNLWQAGRGGSREEINENDNAIRYDDMNVLNVRKCEKIVRTWDSWKVNNFSDSETET